MAEEQDKAQQTEDATPKRIEDARKKGQVPLSREPSTAIAFLILSGISITGVAAWTGQRLMGMMAYYLSASPAMLRADGPGMQSLLFMIGGDMAAIILPLVLPMLLLGIIVTFIITGPVFTFETLKPKFSKISPMAGFKRLFSTKGLAEFVKSLLKLCIISLICGVVLTDLMPQITHANRLDIYAIISLALDGTLQLAGLTALVFFFIALADVLYQKWEHAKGLRMSKKEMKDENKDTEGDPYLKAKIRQIQQEQARSRMMADVPKADVVITNPTHVAVALSYQSGGSGAPTVLAKGKGKTAAKIREIAREHRIPMRENKPLARSLFKAVKVGHEIPEELYEAVAIILAEIFKMRAAR
ncbi:MAG: flagellar biosynthesis protein FlhB [Mariprofundaceae bacterium]